MTIFEDLVKDIVGGHFFHQNLYKQGYREILGALTNSFIFKE